MNNAARAFDLVAICLQQGRITEATYSMEIGYAKQDYAATVARLAAKPVIVEAANPRTWSFDKFRREAPQQLEQMRREEPARYQVLQDLHVAEIRVKGQKKPGRS